MIIDIEPITEDVGHQCAHRLVPRPIRKVCDNLGKVLLSPRAEHGRKHVSFRRFASRTFLGNTSYLQYLVWRTFDPVISPIYSPRLATPRRLRRSRQILSSVSAAS